MTFDFVWMGDDILLVKSDRFLTESGKDSIRQTDEHSHFWTCFEKPRVVIQMQHLW